MAKGSNIVISTLLDLNDTQFHHKTNEALKAMKTLSNMKAYATLKFNTGDVRKQIQKAIAEAEKQMRKAFGAKEGEAIVYKGAKGALNKINTQKQLERAFDYAGSQKDNTSLSKEERKIWGGRYAAMTQVIELRKSLIDLDREARAVYSGRVKELRVDPEKQANRLFRKEAMAKMTQAEKEQVEAQKAAEKEQREIEKRKTKVLQEESRKRIEMRRRETQANKDSGRWVTRRQADAESNRIIAGGSSNAVLASMRNYYKEQENQAQKAHDIQNRIIRQYQQQYGILGGLGRRLSSYLSIYAMANFGKKVAETTGYFEKQQVALEGILGSASKAQSVLSQIKDFALHSPFQTKELVTFTKQLAAFSIPSDQLFDTTKRLADISAGLGVEMSRIILAYGQVRSAAVLRGQELRQFTEAGIPLVQKLADKFTQLRGEVVTTADVFELISKRQVSFQMVADVLNDMTKEGGQFYKMQENITETLYGQMQKLQDLWTIKMDEMGKGTGSFLMNVVKLLQLIVKNANGVAAALLSAFTFNWVIRNIRVTRMEWELLDAQTKKTFKTMKNFQKLRLLEFGKNLGWGIAAAGVGVAIGAIYQWYSKLGEVQRKMDEITNSFNKETNKMIGGFDDLIQRLRSAKAGTQAYNDAIETLKTNYGEFLNVNDKTIEVLLSEQTAIDGTVTEYQKLREEIAAAIKLKQQFNELKTQKETLAGSLGDKSSGSDFWGTGYKGTSNAYADMVSNILAGIYGPAKNKKEGSRRINKLFGTNYSGDAIKELKKALDDIAKNTIDQFTSSVVIPFGFDELSEEEKNKYLGTEFSKMYKSNFANEFLFNTLSKQENDFLKNLDTTIANKLFADMSNQGDTWKEFVKAANKMAGNGTDLLSAMIRINNEFDKYDPSKNEGVGVVGKQAWANQEYIRLLKNASVEFGALGGNQGKLDALINLLNKPYSQSSVSDIITALNEFFKTIEDASRREIVANATKRFKEGTDQLTDQEEKIATRMGLNNTWAGINRGEINGVNLQGFIDNYNPAALGEQTVHQTRDKIRSAYEDLQKELKTYTKNATLFADDIKLVNAKMRILERLAESDLYALDLTEKSKGGSIRGGGWRRMFSDLFGYIKEARDEEKKLVDHSAGLTDALIDQINSEQLQGTAVNAFYSERNPFQKFINKMDEYELESEVFDKDFLHNTLSDIYAKQIEATGTIDFKDVWDQLIGVIKGRIDELSSDPKMKSTVDLMKNYLAQMVMEREKLFSRNAVEKLIEDQLKELRRINGQFEKMRSEQKAIESIRNSSNAFRAYGALGTGFSSGSNITQNQLLAMLNAKGGKGLSLATPLAKLINGGKLGISSISQVLSVKQGLSGITTAEMQGDTDAERQANFDEFKGVLGQFDQLLGQLVEDILEDYRKLMELRDPARKAADEIVNAFDEYYKAMELIADGLDNGNVKEGEEDAMRVQAVQNLYTAIAKGLGGNGMPGYINRLFPEFETPAGISKQGYELGMWLGEGSLKERIANYAATLIQDPELQRENFTSDEAYEKAVEEATKEIENMTKSLQDFADKMELTGAIISKVDSYIQKSAQFANKLIDAINANNGLTLDEYGNVTQEQDYSTAKEAINMIAEFSGGISSAFQSLMSGDVFGAITGIGSAIAGFFENIFGIGDSQIQKQQDKLTSSNKALERAMTNLQHTLQDVAGKDKWDNLTEQIKNLREQQENQGTLYDMEMGKKHGDADKAQSYKDREEELGREAEDLVRSIREEVLGTADDIASQFTDAFAEAFRNGENMARAWRDSVRTYIADTLKDVLLASVAKSKINDILKKYGIVEGETSADEILAIMSDPTKVKGLRNDMFATGTFLEDWLYSLPEGIREMMGYNSSTSELSGGIQGITEDTARTLEGLSNSILAQHVITNRYLNDLSVSGFAEVQISWFNDMLNLQKQIATNTQTVSDVLTGSRDGIRSLQVRIE